MITKTQRVCRRDCGLSRTWLLLAIAGLGTFLVGAGLMLRARRGETVMRPYYRFVEAHMRPSASTGLSLRITPRLALRSYHPVATIRHATRPVLFSPAQETVVPRQPVMVPPDGTVRFSPVLTGELRRADRVLLMPSVLGRSGWQALPVAMGEVRRTAEAAAVNIKLTLPLQEAGSSITTRVDAVAISDARTTSWRTAEVRIPSGARLDFGVGVLEPAWSQGPVDFRVKACSGETCEPVFSETLDPRAESARAWHDRSVSLAHLTWRKRAFVFETELQQAHEGAFSLPVWADPTINAPEIWQRDTPNVILLSIDTLAASHLPTYGYPYETAPFIDQTFGANGTVFDNCIAAAATTPPSHMTMFTSVPPCVHGLTTGSEGLPLWLLTLAEAMRGGGFETAAFTEDGWLGIIFGFGRGFDSYTENTSPDVMSPEGQVDVTFAQAREWLARNRDKRFFLFLHTFQVHAPYVPPPAYLHLFGERDGQVVTDASPPALRDRVAYDREIRYTDDQLRLLFDAIEANGLSQQTIFILVSDHGEEFAEHGLMGHGADLYQEVTRVPLMVWGPGRILAGRRVDERVSHMDLMPTILDLAGVPQPPQVMGTSLGDLLSGTPNRLRQVRPLFTEAWADVAMLPDDTTVPFDRPAYMVQIGDRKLLRYRQAGGFRYEYYDLRTDPDERRDLYHEGMGGIADLRAQVDGYEAVCKARAMSLAGADMQAMARGAEHVHLDPAEEEKLRALGYLK